MNTEQGGWMITEKDLLTKMEDKRGIKKMKKFYFTFGSDPKYPFGREDFIEVHAANLLGAQKAYKKIHPNRPGSNLINCAEIYDEKTWEKDIYPKYYTGKKPVEIISARAISR